MNGEKMKLQTRSKISIMYLDSGSHHFGFDCKIRYMESRWNENVYAFQFTLIHSHKHTKWSVALPLLLPTKISISVDTIINREHKTVVAAQHNMPHSHFVNTAKARQRSVELYSLFIHIHLLVCKRIRETEKRNYILTTLLWIALKFSFSRRSINENRCVN